MFGRRYCVCNFLEMKYKSITLLIAVIIASGNFQKNIFVVANEQQLAEQLGKKTKKKIYTYTHANMKGIK